MLVLLLFVFVILRLMLLLGVSPHVVARKLPSQPSSPPSSSLFTVLLREPPELTGVARFASALVLLAQIPFGCGPGGHMRRNSIERKGVWSVWSVSGAALSGCSRMLPISCGSCVVVWPHVKQDKEVCCCPTADVCALVCMCVCVCLYVCVCVCVCVLSLPGLHACGDLHLYIGSCLLY